MPASSQHLISLASVPLSILENESRLKPRNPLFLPFLYLLSGQAQPASPSLSPFCADANPDTGTSSCNCWCPPKHGRWNDTGSCFPLTDIPPEKAPPATTTTATTTTATAVCNGKGDPPSCQAEYSDKCNDAIVGAAIKEQCPVMCDTCFGEKAKAGNQDGKTNVNVDGGTASTDDGGNATGGDSDVLPPPTSNSSAALIVGLLVPLLLIAGIAGYVISARKKEQAKRRGVTRSRGPAARNNPTFSVGNQNDAADGGINDGANVTGAPVYDQAKPTQPEAVYDEATSSGQATYSLAQQNNAMPEGATFVGGSGSDASAQQQQQQPFYDEAMQPGAVYDEASSSGQADYSLAHATTLYLTPLQSDDV